MVVAQIRSRGEIKIEDILKENNIPFEREYSFPDLVSSSGRPLRFDFAVFNDAGEVEFLIEYQGKQHYQGYEYFGGKKAFYHQKYNDNEKRKYCAQHNIPLVVIPYWDYEEISYDYIMKRAYNW